MVDVNLVLQTMGGQLLEPGKWINVIGYVQSQYGIQVQPKPVIRPKRKQLDKNLSEEPKRPLVQAVLIWDAGTAKAEEYEKILEAQREAWKKTRHLHKAYQ